MPVAIQCTPGAHALKNPFRFLSTPPPYITCTNCMLYFLSSHSCEQNMGSNSPAKSASSRPYKDIQGYIHAVSEVQIPANPKSSRYFDFTIQENDEKNASDLFHARKQRWAETTGGSTTPYFSQKRRYCEGVEYRMNEYSRIEQAKNLAFQWKPSNTDESDITVTQLPQSTPNGQSVRLKAKVLFKGDADTVYSKHAKKKPYQMWPGCCWHYWSDHCNSVGKSNRRSWTALLLSLQRT